MDATLEQLLKQPLLDPLSEEELQALLPLFRVQSYEADEVVFRQGEEARNFYLIASGEFEVVYEEGKQAQRINLLYPGEFFGDIALLYDEPRAATVRAVDDSKVLVLNKEDFLKLMERSHQLSQRLEQLGREIEERTHKRFPGQGDNEVVLYYERRHWMALVRRLAKVAFFVLLWFALMAGAAYLFRDDPVNQNRIAWIGLFSMLVPAALGLWEFLDWYNDYYIVTNERVIHIEQVIAFSYERFEAPLNKIQNVNVAHATPLSEFLDYGKMIIATAAQGGPGTTLLFDYMPNADVIAERIIQELSKERGILQQQGKEQKRRALRAALGMEPSTEAPAPASAPAAPPPVERRSLPGLLRSMFRYLRPQMREQRGNTIVWRKHWLLLLRDSLLAWVILLLLAAGILTELLFFDLSLRGVQFSVWIGILLLLLDVAWLAWIYEDWRNDLYILTPDAILDQEQNPLGFAKEVRRAPLDTIQDLRYVQNNPIMVWFGVGNVLIQTAGQQGLFTFDWVKNPREVQYDIFQYIQARVAQRERNEAAAINQELLELLRLYDTERREAERRSRPPREQPQPPPAPGDAPPADPNATTRQWPPSV